MSLCLLVCFLQEGGKPIETGTLSCSPGLCPHRRLSAGTRGAWAVLTRQGIGPKGLSLAARDCLVLLFRLNTTTRPLLTPPPPLCTARQARKGKEVRPPDSQSTSCHWSIVPTLSTVTLSQELLGITGLIFLMLFREILGSESSF